MIKKQHNKNKISAIFTLGLSLILLGCTGAPESTLKSGAETMTFDSQAEARKVLHGDQIFCDGDCPETVGAFFLYHEKKVDGYMTSYQIVTCSGTLIAEDQFLTNHHCIEGILKEGDALDPNNDNMYIEIKFPKTKNLPYVSVTGTKVLKTSTVLTRYIAPDWAVIQLNGKVPGRKPVEMGAAPIVDDQAVELYPVYFDKSTSPASGLIRQVKCQQAFNQSADIFAMDQDSPLFVVDHCSHQLIHGNSGTGVFAAGTNKMIGVMAGNGTAPDSVRGTVSQCIPNFMTSSSECLFNDDQQFTEVYKQMNILGLYRRQLLQNNFDMAAQFGNFFEFAPGVSVEPYVELSDRLQNFVQYLDRPESQILKAKYISHYSQLVYLFRPSCVKATSGPQVFLPLVDVSDWTFSQAIWQEAPIPGSNEASINYSLPGLQISLLPIEMSVTPKDASTVILEARGVLPEPFKRFMVTLPICK